MLLSSLREKRFLYVYIKFNIFLHILILIENISSKLMAHTFYIIILYLADVVAAAASSSSDDDDDVF